MKFVSLLYLAVELSDIYMLIIGLIAFIIGLSSFIGALSVIYSKGWKPIKDRFQDTFFKPLDDVVSKVTDFGEKVTSLTERIASLENTIQKTDVANLEAGQKKISLEVSLALFKIKRINQRAKEPIFVTDDTLNVTFVNSALCDLLNIDSSAFEKRGWHQLIASEERSRVLADWKLCLNERSAFEAPVTFIVESEGTFLKTKYVLTAEPFIYDDEVKNYFGSIKKV